MRLTCLVLKCLYKELIHKDSCAQLFISVTFSTNMPFFFLLAKTNRLCPGPTWSSTILWQAGLDQLTTAASSRIAGLVPCWRVRSTLASSLATLAMPANRTFSHSGHTFVQCTDTQWGKVIANRKLLASLLKLFLWYLVIGKAQYLHVENDEQR